MRKILSTLLYMIPVAVLAVGNADVGEELSMVCAACHGEKGISANPEWPNLAGQYPSYLQQQLQAYQQGKTRQAAVMGPMVAKLTLEDIQDLAAFYARQTVASGVTPKEYLKQGERLYRGGDFKKGVTACIACHGPNGRGNEQAGFPSLSGQKAVYIQQQLQQFKDGQRTNDINGIMRDISSRMSHEDMIAVSHYIAGLH